jgi:hypothetical protein
MVEIPRVLSLTVDDGGQEQRVCGSIVAVDIADFNPQDLSNTAMHLPH